MPERLQITVPHALGAPEVRRRLDLHTDWALRRLAKENIAVEAGGWSGDRRTFSACGHGLSGAAAIEVCDDALRIEATVPWMVGVFAPAIEAAGRHYAGRLLSDGGASA